MTTTAPESAKPATHHKICGKCKHPKPFHKEGTKACSAYGCNCSRYRIGVTVEPKPAPVPDETNEPSQSGPLGADQPPSKQPKATATRAQVAKSHSIVEEVDNGPSTIVAQPKNLADALKADYPDFENALRTTSMGHKAVAEAFPFTSETSVRRWRAKNGVVLSS